MEPVRSLRALPRGSLGQGEMLLFHPSLQANLSHGAGSGSSRLRQPSTQLQEEEQGRRETFPLQQPRPLALPPWPLLPGDTATTSPGTKKAPGSPDSSSLTPYITLYREKAGSCPAHPLQQHQHCNTNSSQPKHNGESVRKTTHCWATTPLPVQADPGAGAALPALARQILPPCLHLPGRYCHRVGRARKHQLQQLRENTENS